jgi:hypothetical protein
MDGPVTAEWLSINSAAKRGQFKYGKVWKAIQLFVKTGGREGLRAYQQIEGGQWRIRLEDFDAWMMGCKPREETPQ